MINVYERTGNAYSDGFLGIPEAPSIIQAQGGDPFLALHDAINLSGNGVNFHRDSNNVAGLLLFGQPRRIRVGARIEM